MKLGSKKHLQNPKLPITRLTSAAKDGSANKKITAKNFVPTTYKKSKTRKKK